MSVLSWHCKYSTELTCKYADFLTGRIVMHPPRHRVAQALPTAALRRDCCASGIQGPRNGWLIGASLLGDHQAAQDMLEILEQFSRTVFCARPAAELAAGFFTAAPVVLLRVLAMGELFSS